ncbi:immunoglobulin I-set domain protein [Necator americanus]|uniref:Immunoglobulin I-set domain protein n=1 Tax=Necator americanus TaxID=51031 RepID=W2SLG2_NECAM|nr:immunoglobulin I-set domain protein [Necator americanus]ETN69577.1 immunoglobulin I-set domain protein [Necator americanus]
MRGILSRLGEQRAAKFRQRGLRTIIAWDLFATLGGFREDIATDNIDKKYDRLSESDSLKLVLQYAPRVNLTLASKQPLREGGSALLACIVVAKPIDDIRISWYKNGNQLLSYTADTFFLESLKMEDHRTKYTCQASNAIGTSYASLSIDVSCEYL